VKQAQVLDSYRSFLKKKNLYKYIDNAFGGAFIDDQGVLNKAIGTDRHIC